METAAILIKKDELQTYLEEVLRTEKEIVEDLETILPHIRNEDMKKSFSKRIEKGKESIVALEAGYVPLASGSFTRVDTKCKWQKRWVKETLDTMPPEVKEVWDKVKAQGVFKSFSVTTGGGDPLLVGNRGGKHFIIAGWLPVTSGVNLGFRVKIP